MDELKPCKCGSKTEIKILKACGWYWVTCMRCGRETDLYKTAEEAMDEWDRSE